MDIKEFKKLPLLAIVRGASSDCIEPIIDCAVSAGLKTLEIAMNTDGAPDLIKKAVKASKGNLTIGAGTVLSRDSLNLALDAGASFIVTPVLVKDVMRRCRKNNIPVFAGALTPNEIWQAWSEGASMVKVFPAKVFGPDYFKQVKAPMHDVELLACSGVTAENLSEYATCGASAFAFGSSVFKREWLSQNNFSAITGRIRQFITAYQGWVGNA
ncbi:MAG: bifunctional 4-hydroxy-2-oxoglutarate aldolase/2-dehydro-3-deoxy-phosphogluconate aldolase [Candidatus Omnitrophota bacterium]